MAPSKQRLLPVSAIFKQRLNFDLAAWVTSSLGPGVCVFPNMFSLVYALQDENRLAKSSS